MPIEARMFIDNIRVKGPKTYYDMAEKLPGIRQYVFEHFMSLDKVLYLLELAGVVISGEKSQFGMPGLKIVGWVCDYQGRHPDAEKVAKLVN